MTRPFSKLKSEWANQSNWVPKERAMWQALYTACASYAIAKDLMADVVLWPQVTPPPEQYLKRWAMEIDSGDSTADPALVKVMTEKVAIYKSFQHWLFLKRNIDAAKTITDQITETGEAKQAVALSYVGNNINFGMDKGEHAQKQAAAQQFNMGNVRIITSRNTATLKPVDMKRARKKAGPAPIEAQVRVLSIGE